MPHGETFLGPGKQARPSRPVKVKVVRTRRGAGGTAMPPQQQQQQQQFNARVGRQIDRAEHQTVTHGREVVVAPTPQKPGVGRVGRRTYHGLTVHPGHLVPIHLTRSGVVWPGDTENIPGFVGKVGRGLGHVAGQIGSDVYHATPGLSQLVDMARHPEDTQLRNMYRPEAAARATRIVNEQNAAQPRVAEAATGYHEIRHINEHPISGSIALAGLLPFGRFAKLGGEVGSRVFKVGELEAKQARADSRIGRAVESTLDRHRAALSKVGLMNSVEEKAGRRAAANITARAHVGTSPGDALLTIVRRPKWTRSKDYALRILSEHSLPGNTLSIADRRAFHLTRAEEMAAQGDKVSAAYHRIHARLIKGAAKYLRERQDGYIYIAENAPKDLKEAWRLLTKTASGREDVYRDIGRLSDLQIARRIQAPGRVFSGARWMPDEQVIQHTLDQNPTRAQLFHEIDQAAEPAQAQAAKDMLDASARRYAELAAAEGHSDPVTAVDELFNHLAGASHELPPAGSLEQIDPFHGFPEEKTNKLLQAKLNPRTLNSGHPENPAVLSEHGLHFAGPVTPEAWLKRVEAVMGPQEIDHAARWYEHFEPLFRKEFPKKVADKIIRAFAVSQANASPSSGVASSLVALERLSKGEEVGSIGSVVADNIEKALKGEHIDSKVAAKLSDFIDALRGSETRTWMGHAPEGGAPAPIDIWGLRDLGYIDKKIASKGRDARLLKMHGVDVNDLKIDNPGSATGSRYERAAEKYHEITDYLNAHNYDGRNDWTPAQTQALGWAAIQKFYGQEPEDLVTAITKGRVRAKGILHRAELQKIVEETKQPDGGFTLHSDLTPDTGKKGYAVAFAHFEKRIPADEFSTKDLTAYAREHKDMLRHPDYRVGGWHNPADGHVYLDISRIARTRKEALAFAREQGQLSVFDRAAGARGDWEKAFPTSGLTEQEADSIKLAARAKAAAPKRYEELVTKFAREANGGRRLSPHDRQLAEDRLHEWADANPDHPLAQEFNQLYRDAHEMHRLATPEPEALFQKAHTGVWGEPELTSHGEVKGAYTPDRVIHLVQDHADVSTVVHEWGHFLRDQALTGHAEDVAAKWAGAKAEYKFVGRDANGKEIRQFSHWVWDRTAEEKFARGLEQWAREGSGPGPLQSSWKKIAQGMREVYDHAELPDVSPDMRKVFDRLFTFNKQKGGRLLGAEDFHFGVNYVPYTRGAPVALSREAKVFGSYIRHRLQLFNPSKASAIGRGPDDVTLRKSFSGALIRSGNFKADVARASVRSLHTAWRLQSAKMARDVLLQAAHDLPGDPTWIAIKVDPEKNLGEEVKRYWDRIHSVGTDKMSAHDLGELDHADPNTVDEFIRDLFPGELDGQRTEHVAQQLSARAGEEMAALHEPIDNIKWIPRELLDATGLTQIPAASNLALRGLTKQQRIAAKAAGLTFDAFNDIQRAGLLILSPSYMPVNLLGNVAMNVLHQGPLAFPNLIRSVLLHRELELEDRVAVDKLMGHGVMESVLTLKTHPGEILNHTIGHWSGIVVDLAPRRAAFLHEARKAGYTTADELRSLLHDEANTNDLVRVRDKATEAIVDYERMSPFERNVVSRAIFVYPWIKGATHYSIRFAANHPVETMALALMADNAVDNANSELGPRPFYAQMEIPVSTKSLGVKIPGTDIGANLSQAVGVHELTGNGHPYTVNPRQLLTQTTPYELGAAIAGTAGFDTSGLESLAGNFNPGLTTLAMFITGHDPNTHRDIPQNLGGMWGAIKENFAALNKVKSVQEADPSNARKLYPRSRNEAIESLFLSGLAPKPYNTEKGQALTTISQAASPDEKAKQWVTSTEKALGEKLPPEVIQIRHSKAVYEDAEKALQKKTVTGRLTEIQRGRLMLHILVQTKPEFKQYEGEIWNAVAQDPTKVQTWLEEKLGWNYISQLDSRVNALKKQKKLEAQHG